MWKTAPAAALAVSALALAASPAAAVNHDGNCLPAGQNFTDAANVWVNARSLANLACLGEMNAGDPHDWYFRNIAADNPAATISVSLCSAFVGIGPWNTDLRVFFQPDGASLPDPNAGNLVPGLVAGVPGAAPPGLLVGESHNGGNVCDGVAGGAPNGFATGGGRWYVHVARVSGQGGYNLGVVLT